MIATLACVTTLPRETILALANRETACGSVGAMGEMRLTMPVIVAWQIWEVMLLMIRARPIKPTMAMPATAEQRIAETQPATPGTRELRIARMAIVIKATQEPATRLAPMLRIQEMPKTALPIPGQPIVVSRLTHGHPALRCEHATQLNDE